MTWLPNVGGTVSTAFGPAVKRLVFEDIEEAVCREFGVTLRMLRGPSRAAAVSRPRQILMYLARKHTDLSYPHIGQRLGGRDHTTVMSGAGKVETRMTHNEALRTDVERVTQRLEV